MEKYGAGSIVVSDYDPNWPTLFEQERTRIKNALGSFALAIEALGYNYIPEYASWLPRELFFRKGPPGPWTHHVHLMEPFYSRWEALLVFRDYLRAHPEAAQAYADLKRALANSSVDDIEAYRTGKNIFVEETTAKARAWRAGTPH